MIYIRTKDEALSALSEVLELPERRQQIIQITVRVAMCLDAEARAFLADAQAGLIEGGLEAMRKRRQEMLQAAREEESGGGGEAYVIVDSAEDQLLEQVGAALDALKLSEIVRQLFVEVREKHESWEVARAILAGEADVRQIMIDGVKARENDGPLFERCRTEMLSRIDTATPAWLAEAPKLKEACGRSSAQEDAEAIFAAVAVDDVRARLVLELKPEEAAEYLGEVRKRIELLRELEAGSK